MASGRGTVSLSLTGNPSEVQGAGRAAGLLGVMQCRGVSYSSEPQLPYSSANSETISSNTVWLGLRSKEKSLHA